MSIGKHRTKKSINDSTYDAQWSGVSYAPHCDHGCICMDGHPPESLHLEGHDTHYCPICDDFKAKLFNCPHG